MSFLDAVNSYHEVETIISINRHGCYIAQTALPLALQAQEVRLPLCVNEAGDL